MGIYFIPAGKSTNNRSRTLDRPHSVAQICRFLSPKDADLLRQSFKSDEGVYAWAANPISLDHLTQVRRGEYVVDVSNTEVIQVFRYCFRIETENQRLRDFFGWDQEKALSDRHPYPHVYFLRTPIPTQRKDKKYFQTAFGLDSNPQWLVGQRYFNDVELRRALGRTSCASIEEFLGIAPGHPDRLQEPTANIPPAYAVIPPGPRVPAKPPSSEVPVWLRDLLGKVLALRNDPDHLERDHEDLVASLFELLGYQRVYDIKFRRGNIDIRIEKDRTPMITVEVKADWALSADSRGALRQAYNYAQETGTPFVIVTNGDRFCIYDRRRGMSYEGNLVADFSLTSMTQEGIDALSLLKKQNIE